MKMDQNPAVGEQVSGLGGMEQFGAETMTSVILHEIGVPTRLKGYQYLREAILLSVCDRNVMNAITTVLYPRVAASFDTTPSRVERSIRSAIEAAWNRGDLKNFLVRCGRTSSNLKSRPSNAELICLIADKLQLQLKAAEAAQF